MKYGEWLQQPISAATDRRKDCSDYRRDGFRDKHIRCIDCGISQFSVGHAVVRQSIACVGVHWQRRSLHVVAIERCHLTCGATGNIIVQWITSSCEPRKSSIDELVPSAYTCAAFVLAEGNASRKRLVEVCKVANVSRKHDLHYWREYCVHSVWYPLSLSTEGERVVGASEVSQSNVGVAGK